MQAVSEGKELRPPPQPISFRDCSQSISIYFNIACTCSKYNWRGYFYGANLNKIGDVQLRDRLL